MNHIFPCTPLGGKTSSYTTADIILKYIYLGGMMYHIHKIIVICLSVHPLREVSGNDLTSRRKRLYLQLLSDRS